MPGSRSVQMSEKSERAMKWRKSGKRREESQCKHLLKYLNPPTITPASRKTVSRVKMSNAKTSKGTV